MVNFSHSKECVRCRSCLLEVSTFEDGAKKSGSKIFQRVIICVAVVFLTLLGFYLSLLYTSKSLSYDEKQIVKKKVKSKIYFLPFILLPFVRAGFRRIFQQIPKSAFVIENHFAFNYKTR